jgi:hypothetical protein
MIDLLGTYAAESGLEVRYPFLDLRLVRFVLAIPSEHRLIGKQRRWLHRKALTGVLPDSIANRSSKPTFNRAVVRWGHASRTPICDLLEGSEWRCGRFVDQGAAKQLFDELASKPEDERDRIGWTDVRAIINIETWHRAVFRYPSRQETLPMSETRDAGDAHDEKDCGAIASNLEYVAPKLISVGNVHELLAAGSLSGTDSINPAPSFE